MDGGLYTQQFAEELALLMAVQINLQDLNREKSYATTFEVQDN